MTKATRDDQGDAGWYEIRLKGHLESRWAAWFDRMSLWSESGGITLIHGRVVDQAVLHGLLQKVRDVGLPLASIAPGLARCSSAPSGHSPSWIHPQLK